MHLGVFLGQRETSLNEIFKSFGATPKFYIETKYDGDRVVMHKKRVKNAMQQYLQPRRLIQKTDAAAAAAAAVLTSNFKL